MLVIAHHFITNPEAFWSLAKDVTANLPTGYKVISVFPSKDLKTGTCIWEAPNTTGLQDYLDQKTGNLARNVCYEVNEELAMGLPKKKMEETFSF